MIRATSSDLRIAINEARTNALATGRAGEIALDPVTYAMPPTSWDSIPSLSFRGEHGASKIRIDGNGWWGFGDGNEHLQNFKMEGVQVVSAVARSGGLRLRKAVRGVLRDTSFDPVEHQHRSEYGVWFDGFDNVTCDNVEGVARTKFIKLNGRDDVGSDFWLIGGGKAQTFPSPVAAPGEAAIHIAGSAGGVYLDAADVIYSAVCVLIDTSETGVMNEEIFLGDGLMLDSAGEDCLRIGPKACTRLRINGTWIATAGLVTGGFPNGNGINCHYDNGQMVGTISGATIFNCRGTGAALGGGRWGVGGMSAIYSNGRDPVKKGYGVHRSNPAASVTMGDVLMYDNPLGDTKLT